MTPDQLKERFPALTKQFKAADLAVFAAELKPASWPAGAALTRFAEQSRTLHLITGGSVSIHVEQDGEDLLLGQAGAGCVVGELGLVEPGPSLHEYRGDFPGCVGAALVQPILELRLQVAAGQRAQVAVAGHGRARLGLECPQNSGCLGDRRRPVPRS